MNLRKTILDEHSKTQTKKIIEWINSDPEKIRQLIHIFLNDEYRVVQRAAWIVSGVAAQHPDLMRVHIASLIKKSGDKEAHIAVKRNVYRMMQHLELPEKIHGELMNNCFESLINPQEALAVKAFAMSILARLAAIYPEIGNELKIIIEDALQYKTAPSFKSRAKKVLRQLKSKGE